MSIEELRKIKEVPMMFVMGKARSGTTMLQSILNTHPNIVAPSESRIIIFMYAKYGHVTQWTEKVLVQFCNELYEELRFAVFWHLDKEDILNDLLSIKDELTYAWIFKIIYCKTASADKDIKIIFDKNPIYHAFIPELLHVYPDAKFIHIVRDYRDNIVSHQKVLTSKNPAQLALRWLQINTYLDSLGKQSPNRWIRVIYEVLIADPIKYVNDICAFIGLPFYEAMVTQFNTKLSSVFYENSNKERFMKFHSNVFNPINTKAIGRWKKDMPPKQVQIAEAIAGNYGKEMYGYEITMPYKPVSRFVMLKARTEDGVINFLLKTIYRYHFIYKIGRNIVRSFMNKEEKK